MRKCIIVSLFLFSVFFLQVSGEEEFISERFGLSPGDTALISFQVLKPGPAEAAIAFKGDSELIAALYCPGKPLKPCQEVKGSSPLHFTVQVTDPMLEEGVTFWLIIAPHPETKGAVHGEVRIKRPFDPDEIKKLSRSRIPFKPGVLYPSDQTTKLFSAKLAKTQEPSLHGIVQLKHTPRVREREYLKKMGITLLAPLPNRSYRASILRGTDLFDPKLKEILVSAVTLKPEEKIRPEILFKAYSKFEVTPEDGKRTNFLVNQDGSLNIILSVYRDVPCRMIKENILEKLAKKKTILKFDPINVFQYKVVIHHDRLFDLAGLDYVKWIDAGPVPALPDMDRTRAEIAVDPVQGFVLNPPAIPGQPSTGTYAGLTGRGVAVGVEDSQVDRNHDDFSFDENNVNAGNRVTHLHVPQPNNQAHGTHVAGIIGASGFQTTGNGRVGGFNCAAWTPGAGNEFLWRGVAPHAVILNHTGVDYDQPTDVLYDAIVTNADGMDVLNVSRSKTFNGSYTSESAMRDRAIRGAALISVGGEIFSIPPRLQVYSAGNHGEIPGNGGDQISYFAITKQMKNTIVVGAWDALANNLAFYSSLGPAYDGRIKPDVIAPGTDVTSVRANNNDYRCMTGTSMATPAVTGTAALLLEQFHNIAGTDLATASSLRPRPSTLRAIIVGTADDMDAALPNANNITGQDSCDLIQIGAGGAVIHGFPIQVFNGPDFATGYGMANAQGAEDLVTNWRLMEDVIHEICEVKDYQFNLAAVQDIRITLAWDDVEADPAVDDTFPKLVNDLDIELIDPNGVSYYPWTLDQEIQDLNGNPLGPAQQPCDTSIQIVRDIMPAANPFFCGGINPLTGFWNSCNPACDPVNTFDDLNTNLFQSAVRNQKDHLNNLEQVFIPAADVVVGLWTIRVSGFCIPEGPQPFSLVGFPATLTGVPSNLDIVVTDPSYNAGDPVASCKALPDFEVRILDHDGTLVNGNNDTYVKLSLTTGGSNLNGVLSRKVVNGVAQFSGIWYELPAGVNNEQIEITAASTNRLMIPDTIGFTITAAPAVTMSFTSSPGILKVEEAGEFILSISQAQASDLDIHMYSTLSPGRFDTNAGGAFANDSLDIVLTAGNTDATFYFKSAEAGKGAVVVRADSSSICDLQTEVDVFKPVDAVLVLDRTGSMDDPAGYEANAPAKIDVLKQGAKLFLDLFRSLRPGIGEVQDGDRSGVVIFDGNLAPPSHLGGNPGLQAHTDGRRDNLKTAVDNINTNDATCIRGGLDYACSLLHNGGTCDAPSNPLPQDRDHLIILFSDGIENRTPYIANDANYINALHDLNISAMAFEPRGDSENVQLLRSIMSDPDDLFHWGYDPCDISSFFKSAVAKASGWDIAVDPKGQVSPGSPAVHDLNVHSSDTEAVFILSWVNPNHRLRLTLQSPQSSQALVPGQTQPAGSSFVEGSTYQYFTVRHPFTPMPGKWTALIETLGNYTEPYTLSLLVNGDLMLNILIGSFMYNVGEVLPLNVQVTLSGKPVTNAVVTASVTMPTIGQAKILSWASSDLVKIKKPSEEWTRTWQKELRKIRESIGPLEKVFELPLLDDGYQLDKRANDGVYSTSCAKADVDGIYPMTIIVKGETAPGDVFMREVSNIFLSAPEVDPVETDVKVEVSEVSVDRARGVIYVRLRGKDGSLLGSGYAGYLQIYGKDINPEGPVVDHMDGSYSQAVVVKRGKEAPVITISFKGEAVKSHVLFLKEKKK